MEQAFKNQFAYQKNAHYAPVEARHFASNFQQLA